MISASVTTQPQAVLAFDSLASRYDDLFTRSVIGRAQRDAVWYVLARTFSSGGNILELNCGTGEDAAFLSRAGVSVLACDASSRMVHIARERVRREALDTNVQIRQLPTERLDTLFPPRPFDGAFSNFSGLNCVSDLHEIARQLSLLLAPGAPLLICLSTRYCFFEIAWFLLRGQFKKAFRRTSGRAIAVVAGFSIELQYPTIRELRQLFFPWFALRSTTGIGIAVPPSFAESWACKHPRLLDILRAIDRRICRLPGLRTVGDHVLLSFERVLQ